MREIDEIIIHCSATIEGVDFHAHHINQWHKKQGWDGIGYHYVVALDGKIEVGRPISTVGAHAVGHNQHSIGVCYIGGLQRETLDPKDSRTPEQKKSLRKLLTDLRMSFPNAKIIGHCDVAKKACPCFNARVEYADI